MTRTVTPISEGVVPWPADLAERYTERGCWRGQSAGRRAVDRGRRARRRRGPGRRRHPAHLPIPARPGRRRWPPAWWTAPASAAGDRIVVQLPNGWEFVVLTLACLRAGIVPVMALPAHRAHELRYLVGTPRPPPSPCPTCLRDFDHQALADELGPASRDPGHVLVARPAGRRRPRRPARRCAPSRPRPARRTGRGGTPTQPGSRDVAVFLLSGGTTGLPKLIARTHDDYAYNARAQRRGLRPRTPTPSTWAACRPAHNFPLACPGILGTLLAGGRVVMLPSPGARTGVRHDRGRGRHASPRSCRRSPQRWLEHAAEHGAGQLATLRLLQVGGARLADELARHGPPGARCARCSRCSGWPRGC